MVRVVEFTLLNHGVEEVIASLLRRADVWVGRVFAIIIVRLWRSRIHLANERGCELEILIRLD